MAESTTEQLNKQYRTTFLQVFSAKNASDQSNIKPMDDEYVETDLEIQEHDDYEEEEDRKVGHLQADKLLDMFHECWDKLGVVRLMIKTLDVNKEQLFLHQVDQIATIFKTVHINLDMMYRNGMERTAYKTVHGEMHSCLEYFITRSAQFSLSDRRHSHKLTIAKCNSVIANLHHMIVDPMDSTEQDQELVEVYQEIVRSNDHRVTGSLVHNSVLSQDVHLTSSVLEMSGGCLSMSESSHSKASRAPSNTPDIPEKESLDRLSKKSCCQRACRGYKKKNIACVIVLFIVLSLAIYFVFFY